MAQLVTSAGWEPRSLRPGRADTGCQSWTLAVLTPPSLLCGASGGGIRVLRWGCLGGFILSICPGGRANGPFAAAGWVGSSETAHCVHVKQAGRGQGAARQVRGDAGALDA